MVDRRLAPSTQPAGTPGSAPSADVSEREPAPGGPEAVLACPHCGRKTRAAMPEDACLWFFECPGCGVLLRPKPDDCCVFCSYADRPCPPVERARAAGDAPRGCGCGG